MIIPPIVYLIFGIIALIFILYVFGAYKKSKGFWDYGYLPAASVAWPAIGLLLTLAAFTIAVTPKK